MTTLMLRSSITCLVFVLPFVPVVAADPEGAEIARLVKQLEHDEFEKREDATTRLKEIGEPALDALRKAGTNDDAEARWRATEVVAAIERGELMRLTSHTAAVMCVSVSADGKRLLTSGDKTLRLWDADTGKCLRVFEGHTTCTLGAALSPDGTRVLSASFDGSVRLWDAQTGKELHNMTGHSNGSHHVAFGPQGQALSCGNDLTMRLWDLNTGKKAGEFPGSGPPAYSDKAKLAAVWCKDGSIRLWNLETGKEVRQLTVNSPGGTFSLSFAPDGKRLLVVGMDARWHIWDVESGKELKPVQADNVEVMCAAFSPDGKRIVSGGWDGVVRVWDAESGKGLRKYEGHSGAVGSVAFFLGGKRIASSSHDGTARTWLAPR